MSEEGFLFHFKFGNEADRLRLNSRFLLSPSEITVKLPLNYFFGLYSNSNLLHSTRVEECWVDTLELGCETIDMKAEWQPALALQK